MCQLFRNFFKSRQTVPDVFLRDLAPLGKQVPERNQGEEMNFEDAMHVALLISGDFEGSGFDNIVGNFDGQLLTCGALGWTWRFGDQQKMVIQCERSHPKSIEKYMPTEGKTYLSLCMTTLSSTVDEIRCWTKGAHGSQVNEPYRSELRALWGSPEMIDVQIYFAKEMGKKAARYASDWATKRDGQQSQFTLQEFCFFFDVVVNNGSLLGLGYDDARQRISESGEILGEIAHWCSAQTNRDCHRNADYWLSLSPGEHEKELLVMGWLRALKAKKEWAASVMNRRGILALGSGFSEGEKKDLYSSTLTFRNEFVQSP